jgi:hypothetical protein
MQSLNEVVSKDAQNESLNEVMPKKYAVLVNSQVVYESDSLDIANKKAKELSAQGQFATVTYSEKTNSKK